MESIKLTYALLTKKENEVFATLDAIYSHKDAEDNVVVLDDNSGTEFVTRLESYQGLKVISHKLTHSFSDHRNILLPHLTGTYTFWLDADEKPTPYLFKNVKRILSILKPDLLWLPRANKFEGMPPQYTNYEGLANWPDYQGRIVRNGAGLRWHKNLHEQIKAEPTTKEAMLSNHRDFAIEHTKPFADVVKDNALYQQKYTRAENQGSAV